MQDALRRFKAEIFQALSHPTRIAIVECLHDGEQTVGKLIEQLGLEQANVSQHLAILRTKQIVTARRAGNQVYYSLRDPVLAEVLTLLHEYFHSHLNESINMLDEMKQPRAMRVQRTRDGKLG